ncbi:MAG: EamA family transporter [Candidatus Cloacimonetes bacterium]|nr:EamA family transporter [Candidatus Cloacimonadota bacterium]
MIFILLSILCSVIIANLLLIFSHGKKVDILLIFLGNYFLASIFSFIQMAPGTFSIGMFEIIFGFFTGFCFLYNFYVYQKNISINGMSMSVGIMRVAVIIPTFMSILFFADTINNFNLLGIMVIVAAFWSVTEKNSIRQIIWLIVLFLISGITDSTLKIYAELGKTNQAPFVLILFASAFICTLFWIWKTKRIFYWQYFLYGMVLGIPNQLSTRFFLKGLETVPAPLAYPLTASSIVLLSILCDLIFWRKRFTHKQRLALFLLIIGIILINLR